MSQTFLQRFVRNEVCSHKSALFMPLVPALAFINIKNQLIFSGVWGIVLFVWLFIWLILPCNPNLNCTATTPRGKDGGKALVVSFLIVYGILLVVAVSARIFICSDGKLKDTYGGGILSNVESLFSMGKVPKPGYENSPTFSLSVSPSSSGVNSFDRLHSQFS